MSTYENGKNIVHKDFTLSRITITKQTLFLLVSLCSHFCPYNPYLFANYAINFGADSGMNMRHTMININVDKIVKQFFGVKSKLFYNVTRRRDYWSNDRSLKRNSVILFCNYLRYELLIRLPITFLSKLIQSAKFNFNIY